MERKTIVGVVAVMAFAAFTVFACGGSSSPTTPTPSPGGGGGGSAAVTISIVGMNGAQSFSPNPASVPAGQTVRWVNNDSTTHRIAQDGGAFDTGNLAPGASSSAITLGTAGTLPYHCTIHPSMVGTINVTTSTSGNGNGGY